MFGWHQEKVLSNNGLVDSAAVEGKERKKLNNGRGFSSYRRRRRGRRRKRSRRSGRRRWRENKKRPP